MRTFTAKNFVVTGRDLPDQSVRNISSGSVEGTLEYKRLIDGSSLYCIHPGEGYKISLLWGNVCIPIFGAELVDSSGFPGQDEKINLVTHRDYAVVQIYNKFLICCNGRWELIPKEVLGGFDVLPQSGISRNFDPPRISEEKMDKLKDIVEWMGFDRFEFEPGQTEERNLNVFNAKNFCVMVDFRFPQLFGGDPKSWSVDGTLIYKGIVDGRRLYYLQPGQDYKVSLVWGNTITPILGAKVIDSSGVSVRKERINLIIHTDYAVVYSNNKFLGYLDNLWLPVQKSALISFGLLSYQDVHSVFETPSIGDEELNKLKKVFRDWRFRFKE